MRVDHWIAPGMFAGAEQVVVGGTAALRAAGVDARIVVIREARVPEHAATFQERADAARVPVHEVTATGRADRALLTGLRRSARGRAVVHTHGAKATLLARAVLPRTVRHVATHHGATSRDARTRLYEQLLMRAYRRADATCAVSSVTGELLMRAGVPSRRLHVIENFLSRADLAPADARPIQRPYRLLFIGRVSVEKGLHVLLEGWAHATEPDAWTLDVVGDGPERARLERMAASLGLGDRVRWRGYASDIAPHLSACDALVLPSLREGLPMTVVEALAAGVPVLASAVGGIAEVVPAAAGEMLPPGDARAWSRRLTDLPRRLPAMIEAARDAAPSVHERFAPARWADETRRLYATCIGGER